MFIDASTARNWEDLWDVADDPDDDFYDDLLDDPVDRAWALMEAQICAYGFTLTFVSGLHPRNVSFTHTTGLYEVNHPELVVGGLAPDEAAGVLTFFAQQVVGGERFEDGGRYPLHASGPHVWFRQLPAPAGVLRRTNAFYGLTCNESAPALQIVCPGTSGDGAGELATGEHWVDERRMPIDQMIV